MTNRNSWRSARGGKRRRIAYRLAEARAKRPGASLASGFLSDMASTKALALADWAQGAAAAHAPLRLFGPRAVRGGSAHASIGDWLGRGRRHARSPRRAPRRSWSARRWADGSRFCSRASSRSEGELEPARGARADRARLGHDRAADVAPDDAEMKATIERDGVYYEPSLYGDPYPITKHLIEEGRSHLIGDDTLDLDLPVRILQGMCDPDVPWGHALDLVDLLCCDDVELTLDQGRRPSPVARAGSAPPRIHRRCVGRARVNRDLAVRRGLRGRWDSAA